jgi:sugar lactone lactonase YvrE
VGVAVSEDGTVFVADTYNDRIRVLKSGIVTTLAGGSRGFRDGNGEHAQFDTPLGIAIWQKDKILVADAGNRRIRVVEPDGSVWTLAGSGGGDQFDGAPLRASFVRPTAVAVDSIGRIYVADGNAIRVIGGRTFPFVETLNRGRRGFADGVLRNARFNRPVGIGCFSKRRGFDRG